LIDDKAIYVISKDNTNVTAIDAVTWMEIWSVDVVGWIDNNTQIVSALSMKDNVIYFITDSFQLVAVSSVDGAIVWSTPESSEFRVYPSTVVPRMDGFILAYVGINNTYGLAAIKQANSSNYADYLVWTSLLLTFYQTYSIPPLLTADEQNIFYFGSGSVYYISKDGAPIHNVTDVPSPIFDSARGFLREDNIVVQNQLTTWAGEVYQRAVTIDVFNNVTSIFDNVLFLSLGPNKTMVCYDLILGQLYLSTYNHSEKIWTIDVEKNTSSPTTAIDANGVLYFGAFVPSDEGSYIQAHRLSDGKMYWSTIVNTPFQWSISHLASGEYVVILQERAAIAKLSNQNFCNVEGGTCTEDGCICNEDYYGIACSTFCDSNITCSGLGECSDQGICNYYCDNPSTYCNDRQTACINGTCTCSDTFWASHKYSGQRCDTAELNVPFVGTMAGIGVAVLLIIIIIIVIVKRRRETYAPLS